MGLFCGKSSPDCTLYLQGTGCGKFQADSDIAGIGVIIAFVATSTINLAIALTGHTLSVLRGYENNAIDRWISHTFERLSLLRISKDHRAFWRPVLERMVLLLSDYQLLFGVAILIAGFWKHCSISAYHFSLVVDLAWYSNTPMTSVSVLTCYLQERPTLRNWRVCGMIVMLSMMLVALFLASNPRWGASTSCPAQCLFDQSERNFSVTYPYVIALLLHYVTSMWRVFDTRYFDHYLLDMPRHKLEDMNQSLKCSGPVGAAVVVYRLLRFLSSIVIRSYLAIAAILGSMTISLYYDILWFILGVMGILRLRDIPGSNMDGHENELSFGQIVPVLLLASIILTFKEIYTDQKIGIEGQLMEMNHRSERNSSNATVLGSSASSFGQTSEDLESGVHEGVTHVRMKEKTNMSPGQ